MDQERFKFCAFIAVSSVTLLGCESFNLRPPPVEDLVSGNTEAEVVTSATSVMNEYLKLSGDLSIERNYFNFPLLGGAAAAAGALLFGGGAPQINILKGAGLGAGAITATQTYLSPSDRMNAYSAAADAVACVIDAGSVLAQGQPAGSPLRGALEEASSDVERALNEAKAFDHPAANTPSSAIVMLKDAEVSASAARDAMGLEIDALNSSVADTKEALRAIIKKVRTVVLTARSIDFSATRDALVASATQSANAKAKKEQAGSGAQSLVVGATTSGRIAPTTIEDATTNLLQAVARAKKALQYEFAQAKARLTGCPAKA
jgi:hypothetical protein